MKVALTIVAFSTLLPLNYASASLSPKPIKSFCNLLLKAKGALTNGRNQSVTADDVIKTLGLSPLPGEGGFYLETFRSQETIPATERNLSTAIYYMVTPETFSALHRLPHEEVFHYYLGSPAEMFIIYPDGRSEIVRLGTKLAAGERPQFVVPANAWQGTKLAKNQGGFALLGTTMAPGFEFSDLEIKTRGELIKMFPNYADLIQNYTHE